MAEYRGEARSLWSTTGTPVGMVEDRYAVSGNPFGLYPLGTLWLRSLTVYGTGARRNPFLFPPLDCRGFLLL